MRTRSITARLAKRLRALCRTPGARLGALRSELCALRTELLASFGYGRTGLWGERVASRYIQRAGALVLARNWFAGKLEADIVAVEKGTLLVIEVKTRHESLIGTFPARHAVTTEKTAHLSALARAFLRRYGPLCRRLGVKTYRLDTIEVYYQRTHLKRHHTQSVSWHKSYVSWT